MTVQQPELPDPPPASRFGPITLTDVVRYQGASGDMNPAHHDSEVAKGNGYPGVFVPGLLSAGLMGDWAVSWFGARNLRRFGVRFREQVWIGDVLVCDGGAVATEVRHGSTHVDLELSCVRSGTVVTKGWATFVLP